MGLSYFIERKSGFDFWDFQKMAIISGDRNRDQAHPLIPWVTEGLRKNGGKEGFLIAGELCR